MRIHAGWIVAAVVLLALAIASVFYLEVHAHPVCHDARAYWRIAGVYGEGGIFAGHHAANMRTWLYPAMLMLVLQLSATLALGAAPLLFVLQFILHLGSCALLGARVFVGRPAPALLLFALLACNPFVLPYVGVSLTDGAALACFNVWLAAMVSGARPGRYRWAWIALAGAMAGAACAIRPAYVYLVLLTPLVAFAARRGWREGLGAVVLALLMPFLALGPQVAINQLHFDRATPLPVGDLRAGQIIWGITNLKYGTSPVPEDDPRMFYPNPLATGTAGDVDGLGWYLRHPARGAGTLALKLVGAFDFDFLPAYVRDRDPPLQWLFRLLSIGLLLAGLSGMWLYLRWTRLAQATRLGPRWMPALVFTAWAAVTLPSAVELRFTLPMLPLLLALAVVAGVGLRDRQWNLSRRSLAVPALAFVAMVLAAGFVGRQNVIFDPTPADAATIALFECK
ncbi:hypothetical protein [Luteimonas sp. MC1895]|uniref:hypothetical protein n=1 Tax=Luteimonas sp. MC1895 TaxID=2819513 RepID=UPI0018F068FA|nr:hypothetical protein [Luteimonas sp. MC1895]MBJ6978017.1 hypothetical protein [Luteimonas sp. MC1895]